MCDPVTGAVVLGGLAVGSEGYNIFQENKNLSDVADSQLEASREGYEANKNRIGINSDQQLQSINAKKTEAQRQQSHEQANMLASLGDSGVSGASSNRLISNSIMGGSLDIAGLESTKDNVNMNTVSQLDDIGRQERSEVRQVKSFVDSNYVSGVQAALRIGSAGAQGAASGAMLGSAFAPKPPVVPV